MPFKPGQSGNPKGGRKPNEIIKKFRENPKCLTVMNKIIAVANTLGTKSEHKDAMVASKIVADRVVPVIRQDKLDIDSKVSYGMVLLPAREDEDEKLELTPEIVKELGGADA
jgi:hypothetical protein|tara:strand:+ start:3562 stop:3897 length:336 start_codon:yes stop_codon:yes gene_type:complete